MKDYPSSLKGQFLISMPGLTDPNFFKSVICMCEHTAEGAVGIVINRVHPSLLARDIFNELNMDYISEKGNMPIHLGGPVHLNEIFMIHGLPFEQGKSLMITPSLAMSNTRQILEASAVGKGPDSLIISLGCAGWGKGQLESEIRGNAWLTGPIMEEIIFNIPIEKRWEESVKKMGIEPALLSNVAGHA